MAAIDPGWRVTVSFTEPTFDLSLGREPVPRQWTWHGRSWSSDRAHQAALSEFRRLWTLSGTGWVREVGGWPLWRGEVHRLLPSACSAGRFRSAVAGRPAACLLLLSS